MSKALVLTATANMMLCWDKPTELTVAYCLGDTHCCNNKVRAGTVIVWNATKRNLAKNNSKKLLARPCKNKKGTPNNREAKTRGMGRIRDSHAPEGKARTAAVIHHTPCSSPASRGVMPRSSDMKGRKSPKV